MRDLLCCALGTEWGWPLLFLCALVLTAAVVWWKGSATLAQWWEQARTLYQVLLLVRFSILLGIVCGLVLLLNNQAQDVLRGLGTEWGWPTFWFLGTSVLAASVVWWSARVMFYFRFSGNPASAWEVFPWFKAHLPRILGVSVLGLPAVALLLEWWWSYGNFGEWRSSLERGSYVEMFTSPPLCVLGLAGLFVIFGGVFYWVTVKRREWFKGWCEDERPRNLSKVRELHRQAWAPLGLAAALGLGLMVLFACRSVEWGPFFGTAAVAMLAVVGLIPVGTFLVYWGNRLSLPVVSLVLIWFAGWTYVVDNNYVRLTADMKSYKRPAQPPQPSQDQPELSMRFVEWAKELQPPVADGEVPVADGEVPVFIVSAEGGGIRAAYWTLLVLGELQDRAAAMNLKFARHTFAISGVSGGSVGAATFAALITNDRDGKKGRSAAGCPADEEVDPDTLRGRGERILSHDFLSPTIAVMLFPDLFQQFFPLFGLNDRAVAFERSFETAWDACEEGGWFGQPFRALWPEPSERSEQPDFEVPLLFLNSTVVETGQRLIAAPVAIAEPDFSQALSSYQVLGPDVPLSTAAHNSGRFPYVSPAGTVQRLDKTEEWMRLVDGGYFENSGAVTASEILRTVRKTNTAEIRPVVIHISNDPETTDPKDLSEKRKLLNQAVAPVKALLNARPGRGAQAREDLAKEVEGHLHFRLCRDPGQTSAERKQPLPFGWALSSLARDEMRRQLATEHNNESLNKVISILKGEEVLFPEVRDWDCRQPGETPAS